MITTLSQFVGDILIPNADQQAEGIVISRFIETYEKKFLTCFLGYDLYKDFTNGLEKDVVASKWQDLSKRFFDSGVIANFVYEHYMTVGETVSTGLGEMKPQAENGTRVSNVDKIIKAHNRVASFVEHNRCWFLDFFYLHGLCTKGYYVHGCGECDFTYMNRLGI